MGKKTELSVEKRELTTEDEKALCKLMLSDMFGFLINQCNTGKLKKSHMDSLVNHVILTLND